MRRSPSESSEDNIAPMPRVRLSDLKDALEWVSDTLSNSEAYVCRQTGKIFWVSDEQGLLDIEDEIPVDIHDAEKYAPVPDKRDLDLGNRLVFDFAARHLDEQYEIIRSMFRHKGAYGRFKELLEQQGSLGNWYAFSEKRTLGALDDWCETEGFAVER